MIYKDYEAFKSAIEACGIPAAEAEFKKSVHVPYLCYFRSAEKPITADGKVILARTEMAVEVYTAKNDTKTEQLFEQWLANQRINAAKTDRVFVQSESYYETVYEFEVVFK